jgi:hypothetical protein
MRRLLVAIVVAPLVISACSKSPTAATPVCQVVPDNSNINIGFAAGNGVVTVQSTCTWTAVSNNAPALTITSGGNGNGAGTIAFSVVENTTAQQRVYTMTVTPQGGNAVTITVTQAAAPPPIVFPLPAALPNATVGLAYNQNVAIATGGIGEIHYQLDTFGGFPPIGIILAPNGALTGTPTVAGNAPFRICAVDSTQRQLCMPTSIIVAAAQTTGGGGAAVNGNWSGTIVLQVGCTAPLPQNYPWTGTFRTASNGGTELVVSVPRAFVFNEVHPVTITGQNLRFTVDFDSLYTFVATFSSDFRSLSGTFTGGNCNVPPTIVLPSGTWTGTKQ